MWTVEWTVERVWLRVQLNGWAYRSSKRGVEKVTEGNTYGSTDSRKKMRIHPI
jgi:hypothetical protein